MGGADPSPWLSAEVFRETFWFDHNVAYFKGKDIVKDPYKVWKLNIFNGDVIQIANNTFGLDILGDAKHSMYITGASEVIIDGKVWSSYNLTYHSDNKLDRNLLDIANSSSYLNSFFIFYDFTN